MSERIKCPNCKRTFGENNAVCQHIKAKHGGKGKGAFAAEYEESFAERAIQASIDLACGTETDDDWLLP